MEDIFTDTSFYYFYSTVPQVLAGGIALIGAFLIFFLAESNRNLLQITIDVCAQIYTLEEPEYSNIRNCLGKEYTYKVDEIRNIERKYYHEIIKRINRCFKKTNKIVSRNNTRFKLELDFKSKIIKKGICAILISGILMAICIFILPFVQYFIIYLQLGILITVLIAGFSCLAIYLIADLVISTIQKL